RDRRGAGRLGRGRDDSLARAGGRSCAARCTGRCPAVPGSGRRGDPRPVHGPGHGVQGRAREAHAGAGSRDGNGRQRLTTTIPALPALVGPGLDRVDGPLKVTGAARYPSDFSLPEMAHAALVRSTIAAGKIARFDTARAASTPGVLAVITHENAG